MDTESSQIPTLLSAMYLKSCDDVHIIYKNALEIRKNTPYSFRILANNLEIFKPNSNNLKQLFYKYNVENIMALPMYPSELFFITYGNIITCPDDKCSVFQKRILENRLEIDKLENMETQLIFPETEIISKLKLLF